MIMCVCVCACLGGARSQLFEMGQCHVDLHVFTCLQVNVLLTLPGRSSTLAQSLHLAPHTTEHAHTHTHEQVNTLSNSSSYFLSSHPVHWSFFVYPLLEPKKCQGIILTFFCHMYAKLDKTTPLHEIFHFSAT